MNKLLLISLVSFIWLVCGSYVLGEELECFACSYNYNPDTDPYCMTDPRHESIQPGKVLCDTDNGRGCYIKSQYDYETDTIRSFQRGCEIFEHIPVGCQENAHFMDCLELCYDDMCNGVHFMTTPEPFTGSTEEDDDSGSDVISARVSTLLLSLLASIKVFLWC